MNRKELAGSHLPEPDWADVVGEVDPNQTITVHVHLREPRGGARERPILSKYVRRTTRSEFAIDNVARYAVAGETFETFARREGLAVRLDLARSMVKLQGSVSHLATLFGTSLRMYRDRHGRFRSRSGSLAIAEELEPWTGAVLGFDHRPAVSQRLTNLGGEGDGSALWPSEIADIYGIPAEMNGAGQCVGVVALGGGYLPSDLDSALAGMNRPLPLVVDYPVDGVSNNFNGGDSADEELALDLQVLAGIGPRARIVVYFAANNTQSLANAVRQAVSDDVNRPQVLSISWGSAEKFWAESVRQALEDSFVDACKLHVTVVAAAGDFLATSGLTDGRAHVLFPASSPYALACGGTQITLASDGVTVQDESVWNGGSIGTGGGISDIFDTPDYQSSAKLPSSFNDGRQRRGLPDVAAAAGQSPGYRIVLNGENLVKDGTSAAAPLWAALITLANQKRGQSVGFIHPFLYATPSLCRGITQGNNRINGVGYDAGPGWNACAGHGVPNGMDTINGLAVMP